MVAAGLTIRDLSVPMHPASTPPHLSLEGTRLLAATSPLVRLVLNQAWQGKVDPDWNQANKTRRHTNIVGIKIQYASAERPKGIVFNNL